MKTISNKLRKALFSSETSEVVVILIKLTYVIESVSYDFYISTDNRDSFTISGVDLKGTLSTVDDGSTEEKYVYFPVEIALPDDSDENPVGTLTICNIDAELTAIIRSIANKDPLVAKLMIVLADTPNVLEMKFENFYFGSITYDQFVISSRLILDNLLNEPYPGGTMLPSNCPGLY